ncbi:MAG: glycogen/starch synthase, partial [bacterium]
MRIAMFSWESMHSINIGGVGNHVTELAAGLERKGHEV